MLKSSLMALLIVSLTIALPASIAPANAADGVARSYKGWPAPKTRVRPGHRVCRHKFPDGQKAVWVCPKSVPCCAWDATKYAVCGTELLGCF